MKRHLVYGMSLTLCLMVATLTGCDKDKKELIDYTETAFGMELSMVGVQGGEFMMGATPEQEDEADDDEKPVHKVRLSSFYIGKFEVTQGQWEKVMGLSASQQRDKANPSWPMCGVGSDYPMYYVSWEDAMAFCAELSRQTGKKYTLPTEAQWEYAARGGQQNEGTKYAGSNTIDEVAWFDGNSGEVNHIVGSKRPNGLGLYDMSGNVWEWCRDWYGEEYYGSSPADNPQGPLNGAYRVGRGGNWDIYARCCRVSARGCYEFGDRLYDLGFRVVCEP